MPHRSSRRCLDSPRQARHRSSCSLVRRQDVQPVRAHKKVAHLRQRNTQWLTTKGLCPRTREPSRIAVLTLSNLRKLSTHITASSNSELTRGTREPSRPTSSDQTKLRYSRKREVSKDTSDNITGIARIRSRTHGTYEHPVSNASGGTAIVLINHQRIRKQILRQLSVLQVLKSSLHVQLHFVAMAKSADPPKHWWPNNRPAA